MTSPSWSHGGRILLNASRVYYLPDEPSLPPLRWRAEQQRFEYFSSANSEDVELRASLAELAQACSQLYHIQSVQQQSIAASLSCYLPCEAIYGVLPLGSVNSALVYVTEKEYVCTLRVGTDAHEVYAVRGLQWLNLPGVTSSVQLQRRRQRVSRRGRHPRSHRSVETTRKKQAQGSGSTGGEDGGVGAAVRAGEGGKQKNARGAPRTSGVAGQGEKDAGAVGDSEDRESEEDGEDGASATDSDSGEASRNSNTEDDDDDDDDTPEEVGRLPNKTVNDYLAVLHRFCEAVNTQDGGQHAEESSQANRNTFSTASAAISSLSAGELPGIVGPAGKFSYLYYSPTLDLSADPVHLLGLITHTAHPNLALNAAAASGSQELDDHTHSHPPEAGGSDASRDLADTHRSTASRPNAGATSSAQAWADLRAAATTRQLYQWNGPLLTEGFALPSMEILRREYAHTLHHGSGKGGAGSDGEADGNASSDGSHRFAEEHQAAMKRGGSSALPWCGVCVEEVQRDARAHCCVDSHHSVRGTSRHSHVHATGGNHIGTAAASSSPSSLPLYVPSFIRGLVAQADASSTTTMTLLTRTCCRWAGTRYNRRGLEPGHSGVVANMSMASLWVTPRRHSSSSNSSSGGDNKETNLDTTAAKQNAKAVVEQSEALPFAVYTVMRGSVPRRWEQPANLALKPTIKISPVSNAAEELARHVRLLKQCHPQLHHLFCLDTMSLSKLEEPLAEAFAVAVRRYVEGTPLKAPSPLSSVLMEEKDKDGTAAAASTGATAGGGPGEEGGAGAAGAAATPVLDPAVTLVKFNVKKELKAHHYDEMMRRCLTELHNAAGGEAWMEFTKGHARSLCDGEAEVTSAVQNGEGSPSLSGSLSNTCAAAGHESTENAGGDFSASAAATSNQTPRLRFDQVQTQLVRVNCLDCLDRTNLVQSILLCAVLPRMMAYVDGALSSFAGKNGNKSVEGTNSTADAVSSWVHTCLRDPAFADASHNLRLLIAAQGMAISQLYAGTEPHFVPYMLNGHHHWSHKAVEGVLAQRRWYQQNFFDGVKQDGISLVTRQHNPQVFNADIESPFSRDLSGMNRQVMYGLLLAILPFLYSLMMCCSEHHYASSVFQLHFALCLCWVVYVVVLYNKLMRYRVTYTNRPLLLYTRQPEWC